jgi:hypothetical protein
MTRQTHVSIVDDQFYINGAPTYQGVTWQGYRVEGLLMNSRMVQGTFDDLNPVSRDKWAYPDTGKWDPDRNTSEFIAAMPSWREHGLLAITLNLQGGSPEGYSKLDAQVWHNSAVTPDGALRPDYMARLARIMDRADALGMVVILGIFYFGQEKVLNDEGAIRRAVDNTVEWLFGQGYRNVLIEVNNECNIIYKQPVLQPERVHELIARVKTHTQDGYRYPVGTSYGGGTVPKPNVVRESDFLLMHGNSVSDPARIAEMVRQARAVEGYRPMPILFNEDDHFDFDKPMNNMIAALSEYASWGYFDYRFESDDFSEGYQSVPVDWGINHPRKRGFFDSLRQITQGE